MTALFGPKKKSVGGGEADQGGRKRNKLTEKTSEKSESP